MNLQDPFRSEETVTDSQALTVNLSVTRKTRERNKCRDLCLFRCLSSPHVNESRPLRCRSVRFVQHFALAVVYYRFLQSVTFG